MTALDQSGRSSMMTDDNYARYPNTHRARHRLKPDYAHAPASLLGDHSVCDPPDPISNSAVKPDRADGTIAQALEE